MERQSLAVRRPFAPSSEAELRGVGSRSAAEIGRGHGDGRHRVAWLVELADDQRLVFGRCLSDSERDETDRDHGDDPRFASLEPRRPAG